MARIQNKKRRVFVKPVTRTPKHVNHITGDKVSKSLMFSRGKLPGPLRQLQMDLRKLMLLQTALKLKEQRRNNLKDFLNVAGRMGVTNFLILSKTDTAPHLLVTRTPQADIVQSQLHPRCPQELFENPPLIVLFGFGTGDQHLKLTSIMFQNIIPAIDVNSVKLSSCQRIVLLNYNKDTKLIDFRYYSIRLQLVGVSHRIRKFVQNHQVLNLRNFQDVSNFVTKAGYGSESEVNDEAATVTRASDLGRVNQASSKSAVKVQEIGPRMTLHLVKVEGGLCSGLIGIFLSVGNPSEKTREALKEDSSQANEEEGDSSEDEMEDDEDE